MGKDARIRLLRSLLVVACLGVGSGCRRDVDAVPAAAVAAAVPADAALVADLEGVWATSESVGTDDAETVFVLEASGDGQLRVSRDGEALDAQVEDVDSAQGTVVLRHQTTGGPVDTLTFRKIEDENGTGGFRLNLTYGDGQSQALGFVRRLSTRDRETLANAFATPADPVVDSDTGCEAAASYRARAVCADAVLREQDARLQEQFKFLAARGSEASTQAAAMRQLDACNDSDCLRKGYAQWIAYLDENYDATELGGMAE